LECCVRNHAAYCAFKFSHSRISAPSTTSVRSNECSHPQTGFHLVDTGLPRKAESWPAFLARFLFFFFTAFCTDAIERYKSAIYLLSFLFLFFSKNQKAETRSKSSAISSHEAVAKNMRGNEMREEKRLKKIPKKSRYFLFSLEESESTN
jgi:hypothetical protein